MQVVGRCSARLARLVVGVHHLQVDVNTHTLTLVCVHSVVDWLSDTRLVARSRCLVATGRCLVATDRCLVATDRCLTIVIVGNWLLLVGIGRYLLQRSRYLWLSLRHHLRLTVVQLLTATTVFTRAHFRLLLLLRAQFSVLFIG